MPYRFRLSIGQVMGLIAVSALLMANAIFVTQGNLTLYMVLFSAILFAGLGVLVYNRRLSAWMWVWIVGQSCELLLITVRELLSPLFSHYTFVAIEMSLFLVCSLLSVVGFAMTFRDIRRKLAVYESAPSSEAQGSTTLTDRSDCQVRTVGEEVPRHRP
jgi:hypothetical protein